MPADILAYWSGFSYSYTCLYTLEKRKDETPYLVPVRKKLIRFVGRESLSRELMDFAHSLAFDSVDLLHVSEGESNHQDRRQQETKELE